MAHDVIVIVLFWCKNNLPSTIIAPICAEEASSQASCVDSDAKCALWASQGECQSNAVWMMANCRRSCQSCQGGDRAWKLRSNLTANYDNSTTNGTKIVTIESDESKQTVRVFGRMVMSWNDAKITWDKDQWGISWLNFYWIQIWTPQLLQINSPSNSPGTISSKVLAANYTGYEISDSKYVIQILGTDWHSNPFDVQTNNCELCINIKRNAVFYITEMLIPALVNTALTLSSVLFQLSKIQPTVLAFSVVSQILSLTMINTRLPAFTNSTPTILKYAGFNLVITCFLFIVSLLLRKISQSTSNIPPPHLINRFVGFVENFLPMPSMDSKDAQESNSGVYSRIAHTINNLTFAFFTLIYMLVIVYLENLLWPYDVGKFVADHTDLVQINEQKVLETAELVSFWVPYLVGSLRRNPLLVMLADTINFAFWSSAGGGVEYDGKEYTGYYSAAALMKHAIDAGQYAVLDPHCWQKMTMQDFDKLPLMHLRLKAINEAGNVIVRKYDGLVLNLLKAADGSAQRLIQLLVRDFSSFRDSSQFEGKTRMFDSCKHKVSFKVMFLKRAQIFAADIYSALKNDPTVPTLTMFADYRVPQVLYHMGVLEYNEKLKKRLLQFKTLPHGHKYETAIRGLSIYAVQKITSEVQHLCDERGELKRSINNADIDVFLWLYRREHAVEVENSIPHHAVVTWFY
ncbi:ShKT domain and Neurotransmitter-gated ion-channel ligand-binding domain-containing protein [Aphelenchoides besseyi]|nr:ShKT domain and Neurotransmitter-gated ion-channel ligand-binding domain-containing protein [Aphelenchoides besseyi]